MTTNHPSPAGHQNPKRRNHEATRAYLQLWLAKDADRSGLWFIDLESVRGGKPAKVRFEAASRKNGKERSSAAFAIEDWLYVPEESGLRDDALEDEFGALESRMVQLCRSSREGNRGALSGSDLRKAILGCLSHSARDRYGWLALHALVSDPECQPARASQFEATAHKELVANARLFLRHYEKLVDTYSWTIFWGVPDPLLVCDRPCWDVRLRARAPAETVYMPLSPDSMLMGSHDDRPGSVQFIDVAQRTSGMWHLWNKMTIERARSWLLGTDPQALARWLPEFSSDKLEARLRGDQSVGLTRS